VTLEQTLDESVCAVCLQCIVLALPFIDDILYNDVSIFDREDEFFAFVMLVIVTQKTVFFCLMIVIHRAEKYMMKERRER